MSVVVEMEIASAGATPIRPRRFVKGAVKIWAPIVSLALLPFLLMFANPDVFFTVGRSLDPWIYFGYYVSLPDYITTFPGAYYGTRLSTILPGWLAYHTFPPLIANYVLHVSLYYISVFSIYMIVKQTLSKRAGFLLAAFFGCFHLVLTPFSSDYVDAFGITYLLLAILMVTRASRSPRWQWWSAGAGVFSAALGIANPFYCVLVVFLIAYYVFANHHGRRNSIIYSEIWFAVGAVGVTLGLSIVNQSLGGDFWFFLASVKWISNHVQTENFAYMSPSLWIPQAYWVHFHVIVLLGAVLCLLRRNREKTEQDTFNKFYQWQFIAAFFVFCGLEISQLVLPLSYSYYTTLLIPFSVLALAGQIRWACVLLSDKEYAALALAAVVLFILSSVLTDAWPVSSATLRFAFILAGIAAVILMRTAGTLRTAAFIVVSLAVLNVVSNQLGRPGRSSGKCADTSPMPWDGRRREVFDTVSGCLKIIRSLDETGNVYFWFNGDTWANNNLPPIYDAVASTHLWYYRLVGREFPKISAEVRPHTTIVVLTKDPQALQKAKSALQGKLSLEVVRKTTAGVAPFSFDMLVLKTSRVRNIEAALTPIFAIDKRAGLLKLSRDKTLRPFPLRLLESPFTHTTRFKAVGSKMEITTAAEDYAHSCRLPLSTVPQEGNYVFELDYDPLEGDVDFGLMNEKIDTWIAQSRIYDLHEPNGRRKVKFFAIRLKAGQPFYVWISNRHPAGARPSRILIHRITAYLETPDVAAKQKDK